jgi:hypothetical protein
MIRDLILRLLVLFLASLAWRCENLLAHQSSPSILRLFFLFLTFLAWRCEIFSPTIFRLPHHIPHHCPFTPVEPGYGVGLVEDDYLFLLPAADLRMDPALRPRPVSSLASVMLYNSITRLNDGIFKSIGFSL